MGTKLVQFVPRTALTIWLLVLVAQGSRTALVIVLAFQALYNEIVGWWIVRNIERSYTSSPSSKASSRRQNAMPEGR